jgi:tetratricopeptide (TPR) repeat protein
LAASDDNILFVLLYLRFVERLRPDVDLILQGVGSAQLPPLRFDPDTEPLFLTHHPNWKVAGLQVVPVGLVFQAVRAGRPPPPPVLPLQVLPGETDQRVPKDYLTQNLIGQFHYMLGFTFERRDWPRARREFNAAAAAAPGNDVLFYNLGLLFQRNGLFDDALAAFRHSNAINPRHLASQDRPRASERTAEVELELNRVRSLERELSTDPFQRTSEPRAAAHHRRLADLLEARGERTAAHGHRLRAVEMEAGIPALQFPPPEPRLSLLPWLS